MAAGFMPSVTRSRFCIFRFATDSIMNMVQAFIWFLPFFELRPPLGYILLLSVGLKNPRAAIWTD
jgi:hypothetical protein